MTSEASPVPQLSRRRLLYLGGVGATAVLVGCSSNTDSPAATESAGGAASTDPACVLTPEAAQGPFFADLGLTRRDITEARPGSPLRLELTVVDAQTCEPIPDADVDVWHADAGGLYSAFTGQGDDTDIDTSDQSFLRGVQSTDSAGTAIFETIYTVWYPGRTTHIHVKVHFADRTVVTTQLYFPDDITEDVYRNQPAYTERGAKDTSNGDDGLGASDRALRMTVTAAERGHVARHRLGIDRA